MFSFFIGTVVKLTVTYETLPLHNLNLIILIDVCVVLSSFGAYRTDVGLVSDIEQSIGNNTINMNGFFVCRFNLLEIL